jgi:SAM-dependent methyltransferase
MPLDSWLQFWNAPQHLYVNPEHADQLYCEIAEELVRAAEIGKGQRCLDFGCGEALGCPVLLARGASVLLCDGAERMRRLARERFGGRPGVTVLDTAGFEAIPLASLDVVAVVSVLQYLRRDEVQRLLDLWHAQLRPGGRLVLGDVISPTVGPLSDAFALLAYCRRHGQLMPAIRSILATGLSDYRRVRRALGLTTYDEAAIRDLLGSHGFAVTRHERNLGVSQARMTFVGRRIARLSEGRGDRAP